MRPDAETLAVAARQAERLRKDGNECYRRSRFGAAIDTYTKAITLCPTVPVYWTNRALCHRKRNYWQKVEEDSRKALQLDHDSVKNKAQRLAMRLCLSAISLPGKERDQEFETWTSGRGSLYAGTGLAAKTRIHRRVQGIGRVCGFSIAPLVVFPSNN
ncbi:serine/threonine-protein phosphatase 5-like [Rhodamnia argentea]|uniref:RING-type E3 ubiquitin transferase n=1 Tax=Rhodamnia argentea TaxID=178133 RepID=A0ABM3HRF2_9MYRT|nr:serine/threonine-protein phosphatase 5-like [Rhodamnia argentea]